MNQILAPRLGGLLTSVLALLALGLTASPVSAGADDPIQISSYDISPIESSPAGNLPSQLVTLKGTYTNVSNVDISELNLNLAVSKKITTRTQVGNLIADPTSSKGLVSTSLSARLQNLAPGATKTWQITFRGEQILGKDAFGVFAIGVTPDTESFGLSSAIPVPWFFNSDVKPTKVVFAVQLTTLQTNLANGKSTNVNADLAEAKRISELIRAQSNSSVSWLVDSAITSWAQNLVSNTDAAAANELVAALATLPTSAPVLPFGHADLSALVRAGKQVEAQEVLSATQLTAPDRQIFYAPNGGQADRKTIALLNQQNIKTVISNLAIHGNERETTSAAVLSSSDEVLVFDVAASNCLIDMDINEISFSTATTCIRAELGMITAESPQNARSIIVLTPANWSVSSQRFTDLLFQLSKNNWMQLAPLDLVTAQVPTENFIAANKIPSRSLSRNLLNQSEAVKINTDSVSALYNDPELALSFTSARLLGYSDLWPSNERASGYFEQISTLLTRYLTAIQLEASARITTPQIDSEIPLTVMNGSDKDVSVSVVLTSTALSRFSAQPTGLVEVASGQRVTIPVSISLIGAGIVDVEAQLVAPNGQRFGAVQEIQISSAAYSQFARILVIGAFGLLIAFALTNYVKRRKEKRSKVS